MQGSNDGQVVLCDNFSYTIAGIGDIKIKFNTGFVYVLKEVRYIPELSRNLISVGRLEKDNFTGKIENDMFKMMKGALISIKEIKKNDIYITTGEVIRGLNSSISSAKIDHTHTWHSRLAHVSIKGLKLLNEKGAFGNDCVSDLSFCDHCVLGKHHRVSFSTSTHKAKSMLEYVHSDLWGPASNPTSGGNKYFLSIIDDYTRKVWVYLLKDKTETFHNFNNWKKQMENQTSKRIKFLRTDNGLEFCNTEFDRMCKESGITRHKTVPYTPQQNGVAERMNRTILDKVRCMMLSSGVPKSFWGEAVVTACYLINLTPSAALNGDTPHEK